VKLTLVHPCIGRVPGKRYIRSWQMEPLPAAQIAGLTPPDVELAFHDDRMEEIPFDAPTDAVALSVETYTAKRAYQLASAYRSRGVPVIMGGFHATLQPDEVATFADAVVVGEAEDVWARVVEDLRRGRLQRRYEGPGRPDIAAAMPDRRIFAGKRYLPITLVEAGRGCTHRCEFCAIQNAFGATQTRRSVETIVREITAMKERRRLFFFVDDNVVCHPEAAKELFRALVPLRIRWVSQATVAMAHDDALVALMKESGCQGVLVGFESLDVRNLQAMNKPFNATVPPREVIRRLHAHGIRIYATFVFGYDHDGPEAFEEALELAIDHRLFIAAFNHLTPFPGTPLYARLAREGRLLYDRWWLDDRYRYGEVPFRTALPPREIARRCLEARKRFYSPLSILKRLRNRAHLSGAAMLQLYLFVNFLLRREASQREAYPLGDVSFRGPLLPVAGAAALVS
jgi:radical SAM superfamily enzyme YgiQ (UPF0313 family)